MRVDVFPSLVPLDATLDGVHVPSLCRQLECCCSSCCLHLSLEGETQGERSVVFTGLIKGVGLLENVGLLSTVERAAYIHFVDTPLIIVH